MQVRLQFPGRSSINFRFFLGQDPMEESEINPGQAEA